MCDTDLILFVHVKMYFGYDIGDIMTGGACGAGNAYPSGAPDFTSYSCLEENLQYLDLVIGMYSYRFC